MTFTTPVEDRYFEDCFPGSVHEFGCIAVEESEIIDFARRFDIESGICSRIDRDA